VVGNIFSKASIEAAVAKTIGTTALVPRANKSFWKGPWPWVLGAAAVVLVVVFAHGSSSGTGSIY